MADYFCIMRTALTILFFLLLSFTATAQKFFIAGYFGGAGYQGELSPAVLKNALLRTSGGIGVEYEINEKLMVRAWFSTGLIAGSDAKSSEKNAVDRNLSFESGLVEYSAGLQYHLLNIYDKRITPYVFASAALFQFNPYARGSSNQKILLQPLGTEGQGLAQYPDKKKYNLTQLSIPFGGGLKFGVTDNIRVGAEFGLRKTFTDYIDDVSGTYADGATLLAVRGIRAYELSYRGDEVAGGSPFYPVEGQVRGNPKTKDYYYFMGLNLSVRIGKGSGGSGGYGSGGNRRSRLGCPGNPM